MRIAENLWDNKSAILQTLVGRRLTSTTRKPFQPVTRKTPPEEVVGGWDLLVIKNIHML